MTDTEKIRADLTGFTAEELEVEKVVQLTRIADALVSIEETGVYNWPQWIEGPPADTVASDLGEPQGRRRG